LTLTLQRIAQETFAAVVARRELAEYFGVEPSQIAQLTVAWPTLDPPEIDATVITPEFRADAESALRTRLEQDLRSTPALRIGQIVAADTERQTRAMIDAALSDQAAQTPPIERARAESVIPIEAAWADAPSRTIYLSPARLDAMSLADYRAEEARLSTSFPDWRIAVVPPFQAVLPTPLTPRADTLTPEAQSALETARWALSRWRVRVVTVEIAAEADGNTDQDTRVGLVTDEVRRWEVQVRGPPTGAEDAETAPVGVTLRIVPPAP
jgi:hypothetical protein